MTMSEAVEAGVVDEFTAAEPLIVCCPDPVTAARRLCGCGGYPSP